MIKAVLFDFDGTLADTLGLYLQAYDRALNKFGVAWNEKQIAADCFGHSEELICQNLGVPEKAQEFKDNYFGAIADLFGNAQLFPESLPLLDFCQKKGLVLAVITFATDFYIEKMLKQLNLEKYFPVVISRNDVVRAKPDPEAVLLACKKLGINPEETVVIGDSPSDIVMGQAAGTKTILFAPPKYGSFYDLEKIKKSNPDRIVENLGEIEKVIQ